MWGDKRSEVISIPVDAIKPNPYQPRKNFDDESLRELTDSIKVYGVLQPIVVRRVGKNGYELIAGERRWRACQKAGLKEIPAIVRDAKETETAIMALIENLQRENLSFLEEAEGYRQLMYEHGLTQEQLAEKLGKSQSTIANKIRLLKMPEDILKIISQENLTERHARALLKLPDEKMQRDVLKKVIEKGLNVRQTEELVDKTLERIQVKENETRRKKNLKIAIKDIRIFVNSVKKLVNSIKETGFKADYKEFDRGDYIEVVVQIPKR
ncbi:nucleoid occlusion protein [Thermosediminibacter litoriperuensis]|uniref:ParB family protein n=1 Tax=Thermosediminibacter litoriperuensis TaxID=291989 RepID=A0A5S5AX50_9FIRM|nr:nucleoid occlusion protein [Thermosediminibacter litoriperuensis]TYP57410.1 ParB family protein [Thermosediminibacter litoriperuensis]